jgi:hypothetical protein
MSYPLKIQTGHAETVAVGKSFHVYRVPAMHGQHAAARGFALDIDKNDLIWFHAATFN